MRVHQPCTRLGRKLCCFVRRSVIDDDDFVDEVFGKVGKDSGDRFLLVKDRDDYGYAKLFHSAEGGSGFSFHASRLSVGLPAGPVKPLIQGGAGTRR